MKTMNFEGPGFTMQIPTDWFITSTPQIQAMFVSPPRKGGRANFMVNVRPLDMDVTLDQVVKTSLETQKKEYDKFELLESAIYSKDNLTGHQRLYKWFSKENNATIRQRQIIIVTGQMLITLTSTRTDLKIMEELDDVFAQMLESFKLS